MIAFVLGMVGVSVGYCFWTHYFLVGAAGLLPISVLGAEAVSGYLAAKDRRVSRKCIAIRSYQDHDCSCRSKPAIEMATAHQVGARSDPVVLLPLCRISGRIVQKEV